MHAYIERDSIHFLQITLEIPTKVETPKPDTRSIGRSCPKHGIHLTRIRISDKEEWVICAHEDFGDFNGMIRGMIANFPITK